MTYEMKMLEVARDAREVALAEGIQQGSRNQKLEIARLMLSNNMPLDDIKMYTGLSLEEVQALQEK